MGRVEGSRNHTYEERRRALLLRVRARLGQPGASGASLRQLAEACGVSLPTLRHYFPQRADLILAVLGENLADGRSHLAHIATATQPFAASIREALGYIAFGFDHGLGEVHTVGLTEGLRDPVVGPGFVSLVLEPSIEALQRRLDAHVAAGEMRAVDTRHAALVLLSPVVLLMLHQRELGGATTHPTELRQFLDDQTEGFVKGYGVSPADDGSVEKTNAPTKTSKIAADR
jgi:AcrR family transcriptional regulator